MNAIDLFMTMVNELKSVQSTNAKKEILSKYIQENYALIDILRMVYDIRKQYFIKRRVFDTNEQWKLGYEKFKKTANFEFDKNLDDVSISSLNEILKYLINNRGRQAEYCITYAYEKLKGNAANCLQLILNRSIDCGVSIKLINSVLKMLRVGEIFEFNVMLCESFNVKHIISRKNQNIYYQEKMDGVRVEGIFIDGNIELYTRNGLLIDIPTKSKLIPLCEALQQQNPTYFRDGVVLCMEICGDDRKSASGLINSILKGKNLSSKDLSKLSFNIFEILSYFDFNTSDNILKFEFELRDEYLRNAFEKLGIVEGVNIVETKKIPRIGAIAEIEKSFNEIISNGKEGIVVKFGNGIYERKRTNNWLKMKEFKSVDLLCKEVLPGNGKYEGMIGSLRLTDASGTVNVSVGSGMCDDFRRSTEPKELIGKVVEVKYNSVIKEKGGKYSLFLPTFVQIRDDKFEVDNMGCDL